MIDTYILLNRKPRLIFKLFIYNILILIGLIIYAIFNFKYTSYFCSNSKITFRDNIYLLKLEISIENLDIVVQNSKIIINNKEYMYQVYQIDSNVDYNSMCQIVYLKIFNLEDYYLINNYSINIKIIKDSKVLIDYLK